MQKRPTSSPSYRKSLHVTEKKSTSFKIRPSSATKVGSRENNKKILRRNTIITVERNPANVDPTIEYYNIQWTEHLFNLVLLVYLTLSCWFI